MRSQLGISLVASTDAIAAPYPKDTKAKGWRFELDYERIEQSDTWALATPDMRPWLLMLWLTAWRQVPCGSLPAADELIAARIGMEVRQLRAHRDILLRGWWLADDGRLYHPVITEQVARLLDSRDREATRKQEYRDKRNQQLADKCPTGHERDTLGIPAAATLPEPEPEPVVIPLTTGSLRSPVVVPEADAPVTTKAPPKADPEKPWIAVSERCPHQKLVRLYHELLPTLNAVSSWDERRQAYSRGRWREEAIKNEWATEEDGLKHFAKFFRWVAQRNPHLMGKSPPKTPDAPPFQADLEWLLRPTNYRKVVEGRYEK